MQSMSLNANQLIPIVEVAWGASSLVQYALVEHYLYNQAIMEDQSQLLSFIAQHSENQDLGDLQAQTLARVDQDLSITAQFNDAIAYTEFYTQETLTYSVKTNKMDEALTGARDIIADPIYFEAILHGELPTDFKEEPSYPIALGVDTVYGSSQQTFINTALIEIAMSTLGPDATLQDLSVQMQDGWLDHSPLVHITPLNSAVFNIDPALQDVYKTQYSFSFQDGDTPLGFVFVHSGYAFGGFRNEDRYEDGKLFGPEDCSSWISKLCDCEIAFSTSDMLYTYRSQLENNHDYVPKSWQDSEVAQAMFETFKPVEIHDPFTDIQPGQVLVYRKFTSEDHSLDAGYSGHTALVLGVTEEGQVVTLNYARNMPDMEGFGISLFNYQSDAVKEVFFLEPNTTPLSLLEVFPIQEEDLRYWNESPLPLQAFALPQDAWPIGLETLLSIPGWDAA